MSQNRMNLQLLFLQGCLMKFQLPREMFTKIPVEDSEPTQEEIDILLVLDNLIPPGVEDADSEDEVNESPNLDH
ncbi:hypothetical protein Tco_0114433 [Tanacetum coccineum]